MTDPVASVRLAPGRLIGTFALSMATLALETALVRVFSLAQGYHFAFMSVSLALLGSGAGGTLLMLWRQIARRCARVECAVVRRSEVCSVSRLDVLASCEHGGCALVMACAGMAVTTIGGYLLSNWLPFDVYRIAWEPVQLLYLAIYFLSLALPFFCSGLAMAMLLETAEQSHVLYAANLLGSAGGCLVALPMLSWAGGPGTVALSAGAAWVAAAVFGWPVTGAARRRGTAIVVLCASAALLSVAFANIQLSWFQVRISPYRSLSYALQFPDARSLWSRWNSWSRVDVVESSAIHVAPGLSLAYAGDPPAQKGLFVDAAAQSAIMSEEYDELGEWSSALPLALAFRLRPRARTLVLEPGGGLDVAVARSLGAQVLAVWSNPLVVDAVRKFSAGLSSDEGTEVVVQSPRGFVRQATRSIRSAHQGFYDVVDVALIEGQQMVVSGAYSYNEDYRYTVEALADALALLGDNGLLVVQRWLQMPPSECLRAWSLVVAALESMGHPQPHENLVAVRSWSTVLILAKNSAFTQAELNTVREFCATRQFDLVYLPGMRPDEANQYNIYAGEPYYNAFRDLLLAVDRTQFYRAQQYDVRPPRDDWPFYPNFFRWRQMPQVWRVLGHTWQPFGGGGYLILLALLALVTLTALGSMLVPAWLGRCVDKAGPPLLRGIVLLCFGLLGIAYLAIEIPLIQRFVLFLDHPTTAFATVVSVLLTASGVGSLLTPRIHTRWSILLLVSWVLALLAFLPSVLGRFLGSPLAVRLIVAAGLIGPLGVFMGMPFPALLALVRRRAPGGVAWVWGINGFASVVASVLTALIALSWGFAAVLVVAVACYLIVWSLWFKVETASHLP